MDRGVSITLFEAEATTSLHACRATLDMKFQHICIEGDSLNVIIALMNIDLFEDYIGLEAIRSCKSILSTQPQRSSSFT